MMRYLAKFLYSFSLIMLYVLLFSGCTAVERPHDDLITTVTTMLPIKGEVQAQVLQTQMQAQQTDVPPFTSGTIASEDLNVPEVLSPLEFHYSNPTTIATGGGFYFAITTNGDLMGWGTNKEGQLGIDVVDNVPTPTRIMTDVIAVSAGSGHAAAIKTDGSLWIWGRNTDGQIGDGTIPSNSKPPIRPFKIMDNIISVSAGHDNTLAVKADNTLWGWGSNAYEKLGVSESAYLNTRKYSPGKIMDGAKVAWADYMSSLVIKTDNSLWSWGENANGLLGINVPYRVHGENTFSSPKKVLENVAIMSETLAVTADGTLWSWGYNAVGDVGDGTFETRLAPVPILHEVVTISKNMAVKSDGTLLGWGNNIFGELGDDSESWINKPIELISDVVSVSKRNDYILALKNDGSLWGWGGNNYSQSADGVVMQHDSPIKIMDNVKLPDTFTIAQSRNEPRKILFKDVFGNVILTNEIVASAKAVTNQGHYVLMTLTEEGTQKLFEVASEIREEEEFGSIFIYLGDEIIDVFFVESIVDAPIYNEIKISKFFTLEQAESLATEINSQLN